MIKYKGYYGKVEYDTEAKMFRGEVVGIRTVLTFQGATVRELEKAFRNLIDDYLGSCKKRGKQPEKPFSGKLNLRMKQELHAKLTALAYQHNTSLNNYINECLEKAIC